jgi:adenylate cyclase
VTEHQAAEPDQRRLRFRIGVNLGDVIVDGDDLFGDGVNIAARLEALAETGTIYVSGDAQRHARGKVDGVFEDLGERELKNIPEPVRVYRVQPLGAPRLLRAADPTTALELPSKPSIAVLPFANRSGDPAQEYFSDGITEDIITALSRIRWFFVIARNSSFSYKDGTHDVKEVAKDLGVRYILEGSVRRARDRVRVTAELIDGTQGHQLWARRYDRGVEDIFAVQDDITETIVGAIEPELGKVERERARSKKPGSLSAWDLYQRGMSHLYLVTPDDLVEATQFFRRAIEIDADLGPAYSGLAEAEYYEVVYGYAESNAANRERAIGHARRAVALDHEDAGAHSTLGRIHYLRREHADAILELEAALDLNPSLALAHYGIGAALVFSGHAPESVPHLEAAIRLSPHDPNMGSFLVRLADASFLMGRYDEAVQWARRALQQPNFQWSRYAVLLASLGELGRWDEAAVCHRDPLERRPDFSITFVRDTHLFANADDFDRYLEGLRHAGVAEAFGADSS